MTAAGEPWTAAQGQQRDSQSQALGLHTEPWRGCFSVLEESPKEQETSGFPAGDSISPSMGHSRVLSRASAQQRGCLVCPQQPAVASIFGFSLTLGNVNCTYLMSSKNQHVEDRKTHFTVRRQISQQKETCETPGLEGPRRGRNKNGSHSDIVSVQKGRGDWKEVETNK